MGPQLVLAGVVGLATVVALAGTVRTLLAAGGLGAVLGGPGAAGARGGAVSGHVVATTHSVRPSRYGPPPPVQHALAPSRPKTGACYLAVCGATVVCVGSSPFAPDHPKACPRCRAML